ncbi:hypothetical protein OG230_36340 [Streptomyces sp. NBC_00234]|uniref:hypothetical protein n=1 Tax=Streptomyces sp. NBC_00234 TaxID=2903638 RepID=UPI002E2D7B4F|nr:hypothetical protein [Streptomyces sp. NBC_00234]
MSTSDRGREDVSYLVPLFAAAGAYRDEEHFRLFPEPVAHSRLAADDEPLKAWGSAKFVQSSFSAGLMHVEALTKLVRVAGQIDPISLWTLLRGALENFATAVWLLDGKDRDERRHRALTLWAEDFRNRQQHETDVHHIVTGPKEKTGAQREVEVKDLADSLGLPKLPKPSAGDIIVSAATTAGLDPKLTRALWRVGSGFAHGRFWPYLRASEVRGLAIGSNGGYLLNFVVDDDQLKSMADACQKLLEHIAKRYEARSSAP